MRHNRRTKRLGRNHAERKALVENLVSNLLVRQAIKTTLEKAKAAQRLADRVISLGKKDTLAARRQAFSYLQDHGLTSRLFKEVAPRFKSRNGGYTRILRLERRKGDGADLALLELTEKEIIVKEAKPKRAKAREEKAHTPELPKAHGEIPRHEHKTEKPKPSKGGFFRNLGKFFKNKGGGG